MVLLRSNPHASTNKMSSTMALVASCRTTSADIGRCTENTDYPIRRRSMTAIASTTTLPCKRPRTSWGKPHSNPSVLHCSPLFFKEEAASSSTSATDEDYFGSTVSSCVTVPSPCQATSFVKTEPLQHLAIKLEDETYDDGPLHQVPTFLPVEHLLTAPINNMADEFNQLSRCPHIFPPLSSLTWPASPHSSSSPICSSATDEFSGDDILNWDQEFHEDSCHFLSDRFYETERDMSSIMGEALHLASKSSKPPSQHQDASSVKKCMCERSSMVVMLVPKVEEGSECSRLSEMSCSASLGSADTETTATTIGECEEEYRIDLVDFEPEHGADVEEGNQMLSYQKPTLTLNYEEVMRAWSDRGSFFTDGSWGGCASPEGYALDLAAWEPENQDSRTLQELLPRASKMITIAGSDDGSGAGEDGMGGSSVERHARVLRYREKRRTRLFSKKIRYEVRKLNAERRPRMKGRFIKRSLD